MNGHTYLFQPAKWAAEGKYWDENGKVSAAGGEYDVIHDVEFWFLKTFVTLRGEEPVEIRNQYEITPFLPGFPSTIWVSHNPDIGMLNGMYTIVEDSILSFFINENKEFTSAEVVVRIDDSTYRNTGAFFRGKRRLSSWSFVLRKK